MSALRYFKHISYLSSVCILEEVFRQLCNKPAQLARLGQYQVLSDMTEATVSRVAYRRIFVPLVAPTSQDLKS